MKPVSAWTAAAQANLESGTLIIEKELEAYLLKVVLDRFNLWIVAEWKGGGRVAFRAAHAAGAELSKANMNEERDTIVFELESRIISIRVVLSFPGGESPMFRYTTTITPAFDMVMPYWPRDILPLFSKSGKAQNTTGTVHASQIGNRSGLLFFSLENPDCGSVFYFQDLGALSKYCEHTQTSAGGLVGGKWPEIGMTLPQAEENPLLKGEAYPISDAYIILSNAIMKDNYQMSREFLNNLAEVYLHLPKPETKYHGWPEILHAGLKGLEEHKGCWKYADGRSYLNAYVSDYKTPPESMVQLAVLLPLKDFDAWSGEDHREIIETLHNGLENFYDKEIGTVMRWLPALEKNLDWSEEQKRPEVMDSWYLHHPLMNLSRLALDGDGMARKLLLDSIDYVIKVARHFDYQWPVFYKMATLEVLKGETEPGKGGEKDVPGAYAHLMIQVWQLTGEEKYFKEAVKAAKKLEGLSFDIFYQANNTAFTAGAMLRLYRETNDKLFLHISYMCIAALLKNVQLWESDYGYAKQYPTFFSIYPLKDAPYTAAYEEQEVFAAIHSLLNEADQIDDILPSVKLLLAECVRYTINRVVYYYPPMLPTEMLAEKKDVKTGEIDPNLWVAVEDLQDGWEKSGQVGQEVYGAGIAFGIVPRQYHKIEKAGLMIFTEYPCTGHKTKKDSITFRVRGSGRLTFRMVLLPTEKGKKLPLFTVSYGEGRRFEEVKASRIVKDRVEYYLPGDCTVKVRWH